MEDSGSSSNRNTEGLEQARLVAEALSQLPPAMREVLILRHLDNHTFPEIALRMGRPQKSVERLWRRGLVKLRDAVFDRG